LFFIKNASTSFDLDLVLTEDIYFLSYENEWCEELYFEKLNKYLNFFESDSFINWLDESYDFNDTFNTFQFLRHSDFKFFFSNSMVDIPQCFNNSKSLRRNINKTPLLRFNNYLMRDGKRYKSMNFFLSVLWNIFLNERTIFKESINSNTVSWQSIYLSLSHIFVKKKHSIYPVNYNVKDFFNTDVSFYGKHKQNHINVSRNILNNVSKLEPLFLFYVYKVDKNIYKNTRGKSGKYTFIWKYVSVFKRKFLVMHWIMRELKMQSGRTLQDRLNSVLTTLYFTPERTWMWKIRKFSHNYVYYNCRQTLAENYRTSTK
jgi:hypothetical protein